MRKYLILLFLISALFMISCNPSERAYTDTVEENTDWLGRKVTFIEIGAKTCVPCQMMQPIMKDI